MQKFFAGLAILCRYFPDAKMAADDDTIFVEVEAPCSVEMSDKDMSVMNETGWESNDYGWSFGTK